MTAGGVFVTGATGTVGRAVVELLAARGARAVAGVQAPAATAPALEGAEQRPFSFGMRPAELDVALDGCDRLFLMRPPPIVDVEGLLFPVIDAALRRGMRQIAFLSLQGVRFNRSTPHHAVEQRLRTSGAPYTFLRPNFFMQNLSTTYAAGIRDRDEIAVPAGRSLTAFIDARDVGRVAATVLTEPGHLGRAYTLSGEQALSYRRVADTLTHVLGRRIRYTRPSERAHLAALAADGRPADYIAVQRMIYRVVRSNLSALPNRSIRRLTGEPATSFRSFAERERAAWE